MGQKNAAVVLTTIANPVLLEQYHANFVEFGHLEAATVFVIPDRKTPAKAFDTCAVLRARGLRVSCPTLEEQDAFLRRAGMPPDAIPYDSDNRRNIGFLMALELQPDLLVSIDDDNFCCRGEDFLSEHVVVCHDDAEQTVVDSSTGYLNICDLLRLDRPVPIYPRGFPYHARHMPEVVRSRRERVPVHINAGLWLRDPDIDAITWLVSGSKASYFKGPSMVLGSSTWSPVNSQNTALRGEAIPSYYFIRMGYNIGGREIDRYGDIFSGYFAQACARHLGGYVRVGTPITDHIRNSHDHFRDATRELPCILLLEDLLPWLREVKLTGTTYQEAYRALSEALDDVVERMTGTIWTDSARGFFHETARHMRLWLNACRTIAGS
ncbi:MAG: hypothetical protein ACE141_04825 [Bryobacteraceae bacterium]